MVRVGVASREFRRLREVALEARLPAVTNVRRVALGYNNVYLLEADGTKVLIDTGPDYLGAKEALIEATRTAPPDIVVATHGHLDHAGLARWWQERGIPVSLGAGDEHFASAAHFADAEEASAFERYVTSIGTPKDVAPEVLRGLRQRRVWAQAAANETGQYGAPSRDGRWPSQLRYQHFVPSRLLKDGDLIEGTALAVVACPGHTPGNIVLVDTKEGWLFSGDQLLPEITPTPGIQRGAAPFGSGDWRFASLPRFLDSMTNLAGMRFSYCWPGHGEPFADVSQTISENIAQIEQRTARFHQLLNEHGRATVYDLCEATYPKALKRRFWQIVATVQGHLDILEERGLVQRIGGGYEPVP